MIERIVNAIGLALIASLVTFFLSTRKAKHDTTMQIKKKLIERHNVFSKQRYKFELEMYQELSSRFFSMISEVQEMFSKEYPLTTEDPEITFIRHAEHFSIANKEVENTSAILLKYAPFIAEENFELLSHILELCKQQIRWFPVYKQVKQKEFPFPEDVPEKELNQCFVRRENIAVECNVLIERLRRHLESL